MIELDVKFDTREITKYLSDIEKKQIPFATARALTSTASDVKDELIKEMDRVFDRPTRYTKSAFYIRSATKKKLIASVGIKDFAGKGIPAIKFLMPQIVGGTRAPKRFEIWLRRRGILPEGMFAVPARGAKLDRYGNLSRGQITKMLANLQALPEMAQRTNDSRKIVYFVAKIKGIRGIWKKRGKRIQPFMVFVKAPHYKKRFDFEGVSNKVINKRFHKNFDKALANALATAK